MAVSGLAIGALFGLLGAIPTNRDVSTFDTTISWNYDTFLNIAILALVVALGARFLRTGGVAMLRMMAMPPDEHAHHAHAHG